MPTPATVQMLAAVVRPMTWLRHMEERPAAKKPHTHDDLRGDATGVNHSPLREALNGHDSEEARAATDEDARTQTRGLVRDETLDADECGKKCRKKQLPHLFCNERVDVHFPSFYHNTTSRNRVVSIKVFPSCTTSKSKPKNDSQSKSHDKTLHRRPSTRERVSWRGASSCEELEHLIRPAALDDPGFWTVTRRPSMTAKHYQSPGKPARLSPPRSRRG